MLNNDAVAQVITYRQETKTLDKILDSFKENLKFWRDDEEQRQKLSMLKNYLSAILFGRQSNGAVLTYTPEYNYTDFSVSSGNKRFGTSQYDNLLSLFKTHTERLAKNGRGQFYGDELNLNKNIDHLLQQAGVPTSKDARSVNPHSKNADTVYLAPLPYHRNAEGYAVHTKLNKPVIYKTPWLKSLGSSLLLGGVSRIAIMAAGGTVGAPAYLVAIAAGVGAGAAMSYYKNRESIAKEVAMETGFFSRLGARWRGFRKSYTWKHLAMNVAAPVVGAEVGGVFFETLAKHVPMPQLGRDFAQAAMDRSAVIYGNVVEFASGLPATSTMVAAATDHMKDGLAAVRHTVEDWGLKNPDSADWRPSNVASNEQVSNEITATVAEPKVELVTNPAETIAMVEHVNASTAALDHQYDIENVRDRMGLNEPEMRGGVTRPIEGKSALIHSMNAGTPAERASEAFNALTNPIIPVTEALEKIDVFVLPSDDARISEVLRQSYDIDPNSIEGKTLLSKVQAYNGYADGFDVKPGDEIKVPFDLVGGSDEPITRTAALVSDNAVTTNVNSVPGYVDPRVLVVGTEEVAALSNQAETIKEGTKYVVKKGDVSWELAEELRGVSSRDAAAHHKFIRQLALANPDILANPGKLSIGQELIIPDADAPEAVCKVKRGIVRACFAPKVG